MHFVLPRVSMVKYYYSISSADSKEKALECFKHCKSRVSPYIKVLKLASIVYAVAGRKNRRIAVVFQCIDSLYDLISL